MQNVNLYSQEKPASAGPGRRQMLALAAAALTLCILLFTYVPAISTWLPSLMGYGQ